MAQEPATAQVYQLLHAGPPSSAGEIATRLGAELAGVQRCLRVLGELGVLRQSGTPGRLTVVRPEIGMAVLLTRADAPAARTAANPVLSRSMSDREWEVLQLLAQGHTDETVARTLGVSLRTARRVAADLMVRLGARSRFQAGLMASCLLGRTVAAPTGATDVAS
jgi:DNA-binding CsgD family transcriptional regulator